MFDAAAERTSVKRKIFFITKYFSDTHPNSVPKTSALSSNGLVSVSFRACLGGLDDFLFKIRFLTLKKHLFRFRFWIILISEIQILIALLLKQIVK